MSLSESCLIMNIQVGIENLLIAFFFCYGDELGGDAQLSSIWMLTLHVKILSGEENYFNICSVSKLKATCHLFISQRGKF